MWSNTAPREKAAVKRSKVIGTFIRITISIALLAFLYFEIKVDLGTVSELMTSLSPLLAASSVGLMLLQLLLTALRWSYINDALCLRLSRAECLRLMFVGQFFNQCLPTSIGGDAVKIAMMIRQHSLTFERAALSVFADRLAGVLVMYFVGFVGWFVFIEISAKQIPQQGPVTSLLVLTALGIPLLAYVGYLLIPRCTRRWPKIKTMITSAGRISLGWRRCSSIVLLSVVVQVLISFSILLGSYALGVPLPASSIALLPIILFVASLPFSFAGWGVREAAMMTGLSIFGISPSEAISISIFHGMAQLIIGLPGAYLAVMRERRPTR